MTGQFGAVSGKNILKEFLEKHRAEVRNVILTEFDEELYRQLVYKEGREDGEAAGRRRDVLELLEELGRCLRSCGRKLCPRRIRMCSPDG